MTKYRKIEDVYPIVQKIMMFYDKPKEISSILSEFIQDLFLEHGVSDQAIKYYVSILSLLDGDAGTKEAPVEMTRAVYDRIIKAHIDILREECVKQRQNINLSPSQITTMANIAMSHTPPKNCGQIMGIRKSTRVSPSVGVFSSWLTEQEMHAAAMSVCAWVPHHTSVLDGGFVVGYANKFDVQGKGTLHELSDKIHTEQGMTPAEYKVICENLIHQVIKTMGNVDGSFFLKEVFKRAIEKIDEETISRLLLPYAAKCGLNIRVTSKDEWVNVFLAAKKNLPNPEWASIPSCVELEYGMELCYPIAPLISWIWVEEVNQLSGSKAIKHRVGYVDVDSLFHSKYNTRSAEGDDGINRGYGLFPMFSCSFIAAPNLVSAEAISGCSDNGVMRSAYTWKANATDDDSPIAYTLDDLFDDKVFQAGKKYSVSVDMKSTICLPFSTSPYEAAPVNIDNPVFPQELVRVGDFITIAFSDSREEATCAWGEPLTSGGAAKVIPFLEFNQGQELDSRERRKARVLCCVTAKKSSAVNTFLSNTGRKYSLFKVERF